MNTDSGNNASFHDYFDMVQASTEHLKVEAYRLRYQVYCQETKFFDPEKFPDGLETDEYDDTSEHFLVRHRQTGLYAATTRLILPDHRCPERPFPMERHARIDGSALLNTIPRTRIAEASRFCVSKDFKRRHGESGTQAGLKPSAIAGSLNVVAERRTFPHITVALLACLVRMSVQNNITHWYGFMETPLIRLFGFLGVHWTQIGPICEYYGRRYPCIIQIPEYLEPARKRNPHVWSMLTNSGRFWPDEKDRGQQNVLYTQTSVATEVTARYTCDTRAVTPPYRNVRVHHGAAGLGD